MVRGILLRAASAQGRCMAVHLTSGLAPVFSLTSPPEQPEPHPPQDFVAKKMAYGDREILLTVPFPDSVELITDVFNHHLMEPFATGESAKAVLKKMDEDLLQWVGGYKTGETVFQPTPKTWDGKKAKAVYVLLYGETA